MVKLSVVIITHNEERNIERCLASLSGIADEVVVVDSGSTDGTESICRQHGAHFVRHDWEGFSNQKNFAETLATGDWVLSLDADEQVGEALSDSLKKLLTDGPHEGEVYSMNRLTNFCGSWIHHCGWYPDRKIRLFNRTKKQWTGTIHEILADTAEPTETQLLVGDLHHYSYHTVEDHIRQADKFTTLTAQEAYDKGKKASVAAIVFRPRWKFFRDYIFKGGFLDGYAGYQVCKISAFATFLKYSKLRMLHKNNKNQ